MQPIQMDYSTGKTCYAVAVHPDNRILNVVTKAWVAYNQPDEANYVMPFTEIFPCVYVAQYPNGFVPDVLPSEFFYQQAGGSPNFTNDTPIGSGTSQGANIAAINAAVLSAKNLAASAGSMETGAVVAGSNSITQIVTNLAESQTDLYNGRVVLFTSGNASKSVGIITAYDGATKILTFTAIATAPTVDDEFVIV